MKALVVIALLLAGCGEDVDPAWQLDHDRIIAVRATPPRIATGEESEIDALLGRVGEPPIEVEPATATVLSPASLSSSLTMRPTGWFVTAPGPTQLADARSELGLAVDAPVPLRLRVTFTDSKKTGLKVVWLGEHSDNPVLDPVRIENMIKVGTGPITVAPATDIPLSVEFDESYVVNWLTSAGTMHDFDLANAYLRVEPEDPQSGTISVVVRDDLGGVAWRVWPISAE